MATAAVHFIITIPTEHEEFQLRKNLLVLQSLDKSLSTSTRLIPDPTNSANVCTANWFTSTTQGLQYGTFSTKRKSETGTTLGGDIIANGVNSASRLGIQAGVNQSSMQKSWEGTRDFLSSARWQARKENKNSHNLNLPPDTCMEIILRELIQIYGIDNDVWTMDDKGKKLQITFTMESGKYENFLEKLIEWQIGEREGSTVSVMNCIVSLTSSKQANDGAENEQNNNNQKESAWNNFLNSVRCRLNVAKIVRDVRQEASITFDFIVLVVCAAILASFGLVEDSSIFLASSMLVSPLMGPIIAAIFGTVIKDHSLSTMGLVNELLGIFLATFVGFIFGLVVCSIDSRYGVGEGLTNEMLSRCELHSLIVGTFTALASGAAAAIGILGGNIGSLIGVAISASLLPPAVNAGLLWALAFLYKFYETDSTQYNSVVKTSLYSNYQAAELVILGLISMCLTISNVICVYLMGIIILKIKEIAPVSSRDNPQFWKHDIKVARDLNKNGFNSDDNFVNDLLALPKHDQNELGLNYDCNHMTCLGKTSYENTWSPSSSHHSFQVPKNYCTVSYLDTFYLNLAKSSTNAAKLRNKLNAMRRQKSRSMDLERYQHLAENITSPETTVDYATSGTDVSSQLSFEINTNKINTTGKIRNFIVTPASGELHYPAGKS